VTVGTAEENGLFGEALSRSLALVPGS